MTEYKIGDKVRILRDQEYYDAFNGPFKAGEIYTVAGVDTAGFPWFEGDRRPGLGWGNCDGWFEKIEEPAPHHKYKVGDKVRILKEMKFCTSGRALYEVGDIYDVVGVDENGCPWFGCDDRNIGYSNRINWFEKVEEEVPKEEARPKYKIGDKVKVLQDQVYNKAPNGVYKAGEIHTVLGVDEDGDPWFEGDYSGGGWPNHSTWFEKVNEETPKDTQCDEPSEPHFWQFGDIVAIGENKGIVISLTECSYYFDLTIKTGNKTYFQRSDTVKFIRRSDFSD